MRIWRTRTLLGLLGGKSGCIKGFGSAFQVAFSPVGHLLAAAGKSNVIALYDAVYGGQVASFTGHRVGFFLELEQDWTVPRYLLSG